MQCAILVAVAIDWWHKRQERSSTTTTTTTNPDLEAARPEPDGALHENG